MKAKRKTRDRKEPPPSALTMMTTTRTSTAAPESAGEATSAQERVSNLVAEAPEAAENPVSSLSGKEMKKNKKIGSKRKAEPVPVPKSTLAKSSKKSKKNKKKCLTSSAAVPKEKPEPSTWTTTSEVADESPGREEEMSDLRGEEKTGVLAVESVPSSSGKKTKKKKNGGFKRKAVPLAAAAMAMPMPDPKPSSCSKKKKKCAMASVAGAIDAEEARWLDAVERGSVDEVNERPMAARDPKLLTARQRAMLGQTDEFGAEADLQSMPYGLKPKVLTEEELERKAKLSEKRRVEQLEKREKERIMTVDKLLGKVSTTTTTTQAATTTSTSMSTLSSSSSTTYAAAATTPSMKPNKLTARGRKHKLPGGQAAAANMNNVPRIRFVRRAGEEAFLDYPVGFEFPFGHQKPRSPPVAVKCVVAGCPNAKKYSCSSTKRPVCSLECYKRHLAAVDAGAAAGVEIPS